MLNKVLSITNLVIIIIATLVLTVFLRGTLEPYPKSKCVSIDILLPGNQNLYKKLGLRDSYEMNEEVTGQIIVNFNKFSEEKIANESLLIFIDDKESETLKVAEDGEYNFNLDTTIKNGINEKTISIKGICTKKEKNTSNYSLEKFRERSYSVYSSSDLFILRETKKQNTITNIVAIIALILSFISLIKISEKPK